MVMQMPVNLVELWSIFEADETVMESWVKIHDYGYNFELDRPVIDSKELLSYKGLLSQLRIKWDQAAGFYLGVRIKDRSNTQFDLLKPFGEKVINIEFKAAEPQKNTLNQAFEHFRFLRMKYSTVQVFVYRNDLNTLFLFDSDKMKLVEVNIEVLVNSIPKGVDDVEPLLKMEQSDFLVSPYNKPDEFMDSLYELTGKQKKAKNAVLDNPTGVHVIKGGPGAGKSLVIIDIMKDLIGKGLKVALIMGAKPGNGQKRLAELMGFKLFWFFNISDLNEIGKFDAYVFDESQRITQGVINSALGMPDETLRIFSVDQNQVVHPDEENRDVESQLDGVKGANIIKLPNSVRSKPEFISFFKRFFDLHAKHAELLDYPSVKLTYFKQEQNFKDYLKMQKQLFRITVLEPDNFYSPYYGTTTGNKKINESMNVKDVIGQEFEDVLVVLDDKAYYDQNDILQYEINGYPYDATKMLYQAITRATRSIEIVVTSNRDLYVSLQKLVTGHRDRRKEKEDKMAALVRENKKLSEEIMNLRKQNLK